MFKEKNPLINLDFKNKKSFFIEFYNSFVTSLYSLFDLLLENPIENFWLECFNTIYGYIHIIWYIFDSTFDPIWNQDYLLQKIYFFKYFNSIMHFKGHYNIYYLLLTILLVIIYLTTILIVYICFYIQKKELKVKWPISFLRFVLPLLSFGFLTQFIFFLINLFDCINGKTYIDRTIPCRSGNRYSIYFPFTIISLILLFFISYITNFLYYKSSFIESKSDVLIKSNSIPDISLFFTKVVIVLVFTLDNQKESEHWVITFFLMAITAINFYMNLLYKNRLNISLMLLNIIFSLILFFGYFILFIGKILKSFGYNGSIYLFFVGVIFIIVFILFLKNNAFDYTLIDYKNINNDNDYLNYIYKYYKIILNKNNSRDNSVLLKSYIESIEETCTIIDCPLKLYLQELKKGLDYQYLLYQFLEELYKYGISKFKNNALIRTDYAFFLIHIMNNKKQAIKIINSINEEFISFHINYNIYRCKKLINEYHLSKINFQFNYRNNINEFKKLISKINYLYYEFWSLLYEYKFNHSDNFKKLFNIGSEIINLNKRIEEIYILLIQTKTNNIEICKLYIEYLKNILLDEEKAQKYLNITSIFSESFENDEKDYFNFKMDNFKQNDLSTYLLVSGRKKDLGKILDCSISASTFFGYTKDEIIGRHINIFIPDIFHCKHNYILSNNVKVCNLKLYNHLLKKKEYNPNIIEGNFFGMLNSKFIKSLKLKNIFFKNEENIVTFLVNIKNETPFMKELIKNRKIEENNDVTRCCILTNDNFIINSFTPNSIEQLGLNYKYIKSNIPIIPFIKQLYEDYLNAINELTSKNSPLIENIENNSIDESSRLSEIKIDSSNISNEIKKKIKVDLINKKYIKKCQISWRINKNVNKIKSDDNNNDMAIKFPKRNPRRSNSDILENKNELKFEMEFLMEIKKAIIDNNLLGYYFYFSKLYPYENNNFITYIHNEDKNGEKKQIVKYKAIIRSDQKLEDIPKKKKRLLSNSIAFKKKNINKVKRTEICNSEYSKKNTTIKDILENSSLLYKNSLDSIDNESKGIKFFSYNNNKENSTNEVIIEDNFIPKYSNNFSFDLNSLSYNFEKDNNNSKLLQNNLQKEAMEKIKNYQDYLKTLNKKEESDESESNLEEDEDSSNSEEELVSSTEKESSSNNNNSLNKKNSAIEKSKEKNTNIRKSITLNKIKINNSKLEKLSSIRESNSLKVKIVKEINEKNYQKEKTKNKNNENSSQMKNIQEKNNIHNYYRVNLHKIHYLIYDFNKDMFIEGNKNEFIIKIDDIINNAKKKNSIIDIGKDDKYPFVSFKNNREGKNLKKQLIKDKTKNDIVEKNIINEEKLLSRKITDAITSKEDENELKLFKLYSILSFIFMLISCLLILNQNLFLFNKIREVFEILKNIIIIKYTQILGIYFIRESTLLNFDISNVNGGKYTNIPALNMTLYRELIKNKVIDYFLENQSSLEEIISTVYSHSKIFEKEISESLFNLKYKNKNEIGNIEGDALSNLMQLNSIFYNLASSYTPLYQNHPDIYNFLHNSYNEYREIINFLWEKYIMELYIQKKYIIIYSIFSEILVILIYAIFIYLMVKSFISAAKKRLSYLKVFYGISSNSIKNIMANCEKIINKLKKSENKNIEDEDFNDESEEEKNFLQKKIQNEKTLKNMTLNNSQKNNDKIKISLGSKIFFIFYILFMIGMFFYFPYTEYLLYNLYNKAKDYSDFFSTLYNFHSNIFDSFNGYREYLFNNETIIQNISSFDYVKKKEIETLDTISDDIFFISNFLFTNFIFDEETILFSKELCSYFITDIFNTTEQCKNRIGKKINYDFTIFASNFIKKIGVARNMVKYKHETELIYGNLMDYEVEKWSTWNNTYFGEENENESNKKKSFKLDLFNNNTLHSEINLIFINIILPYIDENRIKLVMHAIIDDDKRYFVIIFLIFLILLILMYFLCLYPMIRYINNFIYKTKRMLLLIPMVILSSQSNIKSLLNLS